jgi:hypothetical protein
MPTTQEDTIAKKRREERERIAQMEELDRRIREEQANKMGNQVEKARSSSLGKSLT